MTNARTLVCILLISPFSAHSIAQSTAPAKPPASPASLTDDTVLISNSRVTVTKAEYDGELLRVPADIRPEFGTDPNRVSSMVNNLRTTKTLAAEARAQGIDKERDPRRRIASETDRLLATFLVERYDSEASREFESRAGTDADSPRTLPCQ